MPSSEWRRWNCRLELPVRDEWESGKSSAFFGFRQSRSVATWTESTEPRWLRAYESQSRFGPNPICQVARETRYFSRIPLFANPKFEMTWHVRTWLAQANSLILRVRLVVDKKRPVYPRKFHIPSRRNRRRHDARGVGIPRTSIGAPASPLGPKFSRVRVAGTVGTNLAETAHGHAGVDRVPEPSPQTPRGQRRAADDVGASLATARPTPMREQPPTVSHGSLASRSY